MTATTVTSSPAAPAERGAEPRARMGLSFKFALAFVGLVSLLLTLNGATNMWLNYGEARRAALRVQQEKAQAAAERIDQFFDEIEQQIGWTTHAQWSAGSPNQRRYDFVRLLRQVPAITELVEIDDKAKEELKVSRLAMDVVGSGADYTADPRFTQAVANHVWFSPVYFRKESEPHMTIAIAHVERNPGVTVAEVNLKFIWDVVRAIKVGEAGYAYVVDGDGRLIAHPDISLVLRDTDLSHLSQVADAISARRRVAPPASSIAAAGGLEGGSVLSAYAMIPRLDWLVFVELPAREALAPVYASLLQTGGLLGLGLLLATIAGTVLAHRLMIPIRRLQAGAEQIGSGRLDHRIVIRTADEIEALAERFNRMAAQLQDSYETLESKVETRTHDLAKALEFQTASAEVLRIVASAPDNLSSVFDAMLQRATALCDAKFGILYLYNGEEARAVATRNLPPAFAEWLCKGPIRPGAQSGLTTLARTRQPVHVEDLRAEVAYAERDPLRVATIELGGARAGLAVPLLKKEILLGAVVIYRQEPGSFTDSQIALVTNFAVQGVIAIENARLLGELRDRSADLARSVEELRALSVVGQAVTSSLDLKTVLETVVARAVELAGAEGGMLFRYKHANRRYQLWHAAGLDAETLDKLRNLAVHEDETALGEAARNNAPVEVTEIATMPSAPLRDIAVAAGFHAALIVPLVRGGRVFGGLIVQRRASSRFSDSTVDVLQTFASQSVLAIQNARLFHEIEDKSRQLEIASQHKSQFLANMSHELRTPLNAILGYAELLVDGIYGELSEKAHATLERMQNNGKHLLGLINDVLDLSKIEAGQLILAIDDYAITSVVQSVATATESLARAKGLSVEVALPTDAPIGRGDERRLTQVLLNLVGNAIKFTDAGSIRIVALVLKQDFDLSVSDTGPGIAKADQERIFGEFQQIDSSDTRRKGGTGLGLSISRRIVEMHGGTITVASELGKGSTFRVIIPIRAKETKEVA